LFTPKINVRLFPKLVILSYSLSSIFQIIYNELQLFRTKMWKIRTEMHLRPEVKYGFNVVDFYETHIIK